MNLSLIRQANYCTVITKVIYFSVSNFMIHDSFFLNSKMLLRNENELLIYKNSLKNVQSENIICNVEEEEV